MRDDLAARCAATAAAALAEAGDPAIYRVTSTGAHLYLPAVSVRELPASRTQLQYGQDDVRLADVTLLRADLAGLTPRRDDVVEISSGQHAGAWHILDPESQDAVAIVVRCRRSTRATSAAPGATTIRR